MDYRGTMATTVEIRLLNRKSCGLSGASAFRTDFERNNSDLLLLLSNSVHHRSRRNHSCCPSSTFSKSRRRVSRNNGAPSMLLLLVSMFMLDHSDEFVWIFHSKPPPASRVAALW
jgi:hypothetical protein